MNNFAWAVITHFRILALHKHILAGLKVATNADTTFENAYTVKSAWKVWDSEEKLAFSLRLPLRRHIARLGMFSVDPGIVVSLYASAHHPYTTLAIDEWMIFWLSEDSPVEFGSNKCSRHLVFESSLHARLLPATLQYICIYTMIRGWIKGKAVMHLRWGTSYLPAIR